MRRLILSLFVLLMLAFTLQPVVAVAIIDTYAFSNSELCCATTSLTASRENCGLATCEVGQTFTASITNSLLSVSFNMTRVGSPTINLYAIVHQVTGTFGTNAVPTGNTIAVSNPIPGESLSTSPSQVNFAFTDLNQVTLNADTNYAVGVRADGSEVIDAVANFFRVAADNTSPTHIGNFWRRAADSYQGLDTMDTPFIVTGTGGIISGGDGGGIIDRPSQPSSLPVVGGTTTILILGAAAAYLLFGRGKKRGLF